MQPEECLGTLKGWGSTWSTSVNSGCGKRQSSTWTVSAAHPCALATGRAWSLTFQAGDPASNNNHGAKH